VRPLVPPPGPVRLVGVLDWPSLEVRLCSRHRLAVAPAGEVIVPEAAQVAEPGGRAQLRDLASVPPLLPVTVAFCAGAAQAATASAAR